MGFSDKYSKEELEYLYEKDPETFYFLKDQRNMQNQNLIWAQSFLM